MNLDEAVREAWRTLAPTTTWRGVPTGWNALDLVMLGEVVHLIQPAVTVVAGGLGEGGLALFLADCLDNNRRGKLLAGEKMGREKYAALRPHRRVQWTPQDLIVEDFATAQRLTERANPVMVVVDPSALLSVVAPLAGLVTPGAYLVVHGGTAVESNHYPDDRFVLDGARDPVGLSTCSWLLRVPS